MTDEIAHLRIEMVHIQPVIWRSVAVSLTTNLRALHEVIQAVMPWENRHLYQFTIGDRVYGEPDPEDAHWGLKVYQAKSMRLGTLVGRGVSEMVYTYDFGGDWQHRVIIQSTGAVEPTTDYPIFLDGERTAPPEDVGRLPGFMDFVEAMSNRRHPGHKDMVRWHGRPFNPTEFGRRAVEERVRGIAERRKVALEAFERSRQRR